MSHGSRVPGDAGAADAPAVRLTHDGRLLALAEQREDELKPIVVFPS